MFILKSLGFGFRVFIFIFRVRVGGFRCMERPYKVRMFTNCSESLATLIRTSGSGNAWVCGFRGGGFAQSVRDSLGFGP